MSLDLDSQSATGLLAERPAQPSTTAPPMRLLDERQAADYLGGISTALMRKMRRLGTGPVVTRIHRLVRYAESDLLAFIEANRERKEP
jgi:hypothetical protein